MAATNFSIGAARTGRMARSPRKKGLHRANPESRVIPVKASDLAFESTLTERYQTTVPAPVRDALGLARGERLVWMPKSDGTFVVTKRGSEHHEDPAIQAFLALLARGISEGDVAPATVEMRDRIAALVEGVEFDMDAPLREEDEDEDD